jgi:hypothetical protein
MNEAIEPIVTAWALGCLAIALGLAVAARRLGRGRAAAALVVLGLVMAWIEEPALTAWLAFSGPEADRDGMMGLVTAQARAHAVDSSVFATLFFALLGWLALGRFRRGDAWSAKVLLVGWLATLLTLVLSVVFLHSRGIALSTAGGAHGAAGFGWEALAVAMVAWGLGLIVEARSRRDHDAERRRSDGERRAS